MMAIIVNRFGTRLPMNIYTLSADYKCHASSPFAKVDRYCGDMSYTSNLVSDVLFEHEIMLCEKLMCDDIPLNDNLFNGCDDMTFPYIEYDKEHSRTVASFYNRLLDRPRVYRFMNMFELQVAQAHSANVFFEMFQTSFFYDIVFNLLKDDVDIFRFITLAASRFYGRHRLDEYFIICEFAEMYASKYALYLIQRRHGKTFSVVMSIPSVMLNIEEDVGYYCHTKDLANACKIDIQSKMEYWMTKFDRRDQRSINGGESAFSLSRTGDTLVLKKATSGREAGMSSDDHKSNEMIFLSGNKPIMTSNRRRPCTDDADAMISNHKLKCKTARNDDNLRGDSLRLLIIDEYMAIQDARFPAILAHGQKKKSKLVFVSSPIEKSNHKLARLLRLQKELERNVNIFRLGYFCKDHVYMTASSVACPCYIMYKPNHIEFDNSNMQLTNILSNNTNVHEEEMGCSIVTGDGVDNLDAKGSDGMLRKAFTREFIDFLTSPNIAHVNADAFTTNVFMYVDPTYNASTASGIGMFAWSLSANQERYCMMYMDHRMNSNTDLGKITSIVIEMISRAIYKMEMIRKVQRCTNSTRHYFIALENNSTQNDCAAIYQCLQAYFTPSNMNGYRIFYHYQTRTNSRYNDVIPGYSLSGTKSNICASVIGRLNDAVKKKKLCISNMFTSHALRKNKVLSGNQAEITYLCRSLRTFKYDSLTNRYSGKVNDVATDDLSVCFVMALYLALNYDVDKLTRVWKERSEQFATLLN